jgi:hypothetical protein
MLRVEASEPVYSLPPLIMAASVGACHIEQVKGSVAGAYI